LVWYTVSISIRILFARRGITAWNSGTVDQDVELSVGGLDSCYCILHAVVIHHVDRNRPNIDTLR
jgi:hypothetical protein